MTRITLCGMVLVGLILSLAHARMPRVSRATLEEKMHGEWEGQGGCVGDLTLFADGTFDWKWYGPAGDHMSGNWKLAWTALPPTLNLKRTDEFAPGEVKTWKVVELTDEALKLHHEGAQRPLTFERRMPETQTP